MEKLEDYNHKMNKILFINSEKNKFIKLLIILKSKNSFLLTLEERRFNKSDFKNLKENLSYEKTLIHFSRTLHSSSSVKINIQNKLS